MTKFKVDDTVRDGARMINNHEMLIKKHIKNIRNKTVNGLRETVYTRDNMKCYLCNRCVKANSCKKPNAASLDHVLPKCKGGQDTLENLRTCCRKCNNEKGGKILLIIDNPDTS